MAERPGSWNSTSWDIVPFLRYAVRGLVDGLREQLISIWDQQWDLVWLTELTTRLAKAYAAKTTKTVNRDLNALVSFGLLDRVGRKVRARREIILAFLPLRKRPQDAVPPA